MANKTDVVIYIHGVSPDQELVTITEEYIRGDQVADKDRTGHAGEYQKLRQGIADQISDPDRRARWLDARTCFTEWGWEHEETDAQIGASHRLIDAQHHLGKRALKQLKRPFFWGKLLSGMRNVELHGLSDVFYYVTPDGRESVRNRIADQIGSSLGELLDDPTAEVAFTLIGHSAGSVIAYDIVTALLTGMHDFVENLSTASESELELQSNLERINKSNFAYTKGQAVIEDSLEVARRRRKLMAGIQAGRFRLRRLFTLGSPITMLALRSDQDVRAFAYGQAKSADQLGLGGENLAAPQWINIWDVRDPISFPVEPLVEPNPAVKDVHIKTSWNLFKSHTAYWTSRRVHSSIGTHW